MADLLPSTSLRGTVCAAVADATDEAIHHQIRRAVFVDEQRLFTDDDRDRRDDAETTIKVLGRYHGEPAGTVRLFPLDDGGRWQGDRLAVLPGFRRHGLGIPLVTFAVASAGALGGNEMIAHIQLPNVAFFQRLGWRCDGPEEVYVGVVHQPMVIGLARPAVC
jgi:putative N-acetyltransferase (TIGR04045 family)